MNRSAKELVQGLQYIGNAVCIGHVNTSLALNVLINAFESITDGKNKCPLRALIKSTILCMSTHLNKGKEPTWLPTL